MENVEAAISTLIGSAPADLVAFYCEAVRPQYPKSRINCFSFNDARQYNQSIQQISVVHRLGLWMLDDANDSNPYAYISRGPCTGMIIHFSHDPEPEISFSSLQQFVDALNDAGKSEIDIDEIKKESIAISLDQDICQLAMEDTDDATFLLTTYLPISTQLQKETKMRLLSHGDFYVRTAFAAFLARTPLGEDIEMARALANDIHPQVQREGRSALAATEGKIRNCNY